MRLKEDSALKTIQQGWKDHTVQKTNLGAGLALTLSHKVRESDWKAWETLRILELSIPGKVFAKAILNRLKPRAEQLLCERQCGTNFFSLTIDGESTKISPSHLCLFY